MAWTFFHDLKQFICIGDVQPAIKTLLSDYEKAYIVSLINSFTCRSLLNLKSKECFQLENPFLPALTLAKDLLALAEASHSGFQSFLHRQQ